MPSLVAAGVICAVTINGLLTPLERRAALDKIRLGARAAFGRFGPKLASALSSRVHCATRDSAAVRLRRACASSSATARSPWYSCGRSRKFCRTCAPAS